MDELVVGTQVELVTAVFIVLEFCMLIFQSALYVLRPHGTNRGWYLLLLFLMLLYNVTGGLFPDTTIHLIPVDIQEIIAYGAGFLMASYFPFYFYKAFELRSLRWHALFGVPLFLAAPYLVFFVVVYAINGKLDVDIRYGMIVPFIYALVLLWVMFKAIRQKYRDNHDKSQYMDEIAMYSAISPWAALAFFGVVEANQTVEVLCTNTGIIAITFVFFNRQVRFEHEEQLLLQEALRKLGNKQQLFQAMCGRYGYTRRESDVTLLLCEGLSYRAIGEKLHLAPNSVDNKVQNIYHKTGVHNRVELIRKLGL